MLQLKKISDFYFLILFILMPVSIFIGASISLINLFLLLLGIFLFVEKKYLYFFIKDKIFFILLILYFYLILNSIFSIDFENSVYRNFGFVRYILLFFLINFLFFKKFEFDKIFKFWAIIFSIFIFDILFEFYNGQNIFGFTSIDQKRIVSFFKDEQVVGAFLNGFGFIIIGYLFNKYEKFTTMQKFFLYFFLTLIFSSILLSGERSNTIKFFLGMAIFLYFNNKINIRYKLIFLILSISIFTLAFLNFSQIKHRYGKDLVNQIIDEEKREEILYFKLYHSAFEIFKEYPITGVGNKNYRVRSCTKKDVLTCNTHPHQIYFEFLSEHGILGTLVLLSLIFYLIFKNYNKMLLDRNLLQIGCFCYLIVNFIPILPSGSFFADFNANFFWINFAIFYSCTSNTNIFKNFSD